MSTEMNCSTNHKSMLETHGREEGKKCGQCWLATARVKEVNGEWRFTHVTCGGYNVMKVDARDWKFNAGWVACGLIRQNPARRSQERKA